MSEPTPKEYANLYIRGVNEATAGVELEAQEVLDVLDVFGEDGMRWYLIGHLEGIKDREEAELEEYEMLGWVQPVSATVLVSVAAGVL